MAWPWIYCRAAVILIATFTVGVWAIPPATADPSQFEAAYYDPGVVTVFPRVGRSALDVALPKPLASVINLISFGPDGRSAYLQIPSASVLNHSDALVKIEFGPTRQSLVPGSAGLGDISSITVSPSGKIFVAASGGKDAALWSLRDRSRFRHAPPVAGRTSPELRRGDGQHIPGWQTGAQF